MLSLLAMLCLGMDPSHPTMLTIDQIAARMAALDASFDPSARPFEIEYEESTEDWDSKDGKSRVVKTRVSQRRKGRKVAIHATQSKGLGESPTAVEAWYVWDGSICASRTGQAVEYSLAPLPEMAGLFGYQGVLCINTLKNDYIMRENIRPMGPDALEDPPDAIPGIVAENRRHYRLRPELERVAGAWCHVLEWPDFDVMWVDTSRSFLLLRRESRVRGVLRSVLTNWEPVECRPGVWIPTRSEKVTYLLPKRPGSSSEAGGVARRQRIRILDVKCDSRIGDEAFRLPIRPEETLTVQDWVRGLSYERYPVEKDPMGDASRGMRSLATAPNWTESRNLRLLLANACFFSLVIAALLIRRMIRTARTCPVPPTSIETGRPEPDAPAVEGPMPIFAWNDHDWWCAIFLVLAVWTAFTSILSNGWVTWDDPFNFLENTHFRSRGWPGIRWAWTNFLLGVYQPVAWMYFELQYAVGGLSPGTYHFGSLVLHMADSILLYLLIRAIVGRCLPPDLPRFRDRQRVGAVIAASLFAVHPLRTEVVAWVSCQPYLVCGLFSLLTVLTYLRSCDAAGRSRVFWLMGSLLAFAAALLSKAPAVTLPAILIILDIYPLRRLGGSEGWLGRRPIRVWFEKIPYLLLSAIFAAIAVRAKDSVGTLYDLRSFGIAPRIAMSCYGVAFYLVKTLLPTGLSVIYEMPETMDITSPPLHSSILLVVGLTLAVWGLRHRHPGLLASWGAYLSLLAPVVGLVRIGDSIAADRYAHFATMALTPLLASSLVMLIGPGRQKLIATGFVGLTSLIVLMCLTWGQSRSWRGSLELWSNALTHGAPNSPLVSNCLGTALVEANRSLEAIDAFDRAIVLGEEHLLREPGTIGANELLGTTLNNLAVALAHLNRNRESLVAYQHAIEHQENAYRVNPGIKLIQEQLAGHYFNHGLALIRLQRPQDAIASLEKSRALRSGLVESDPGDEFQQKRLREVDRQIHVLQLLDGRHGRAEDSDLSASRSDSPDPPVR
jgi:protein O-mannosyl-transferase